MKAMPPFCGNHHGVRGMLVLSAAVRIAVAGRMRLLGLDQWGCDSLGGCASLQKLYLNRCVALTSAHPEQLRK